MNYEQAWKYRDNNFAKCPYCDSKSINAGAFSFDIMGTPVECLECEKHWQDNYDIVSVAYYDDKGEYQDHGITLEDRLRA